MRRFLSKLRDLVARLALPSGASPRRASIADQDIRLAPSPYDPSPRSIRQVENGWVVLTADGRVCHHFSGWFDSCRLLPGGHIEAVKHASGEPDTYRFTWCEITLRYYRSDTLAPPMISDAFPPR